MGLYGASRRSGSTSRPLYVLQFGQTRCGRFGCLQVGQTWTRGMEIPCWARRLSRLDLDVFRFGTAMSGWALYPQLDRPRRSDPLEEAPIVRDDDDRSVEVDERALELLDRLEVEMVRRLVVVSHDRRFLERIAPTRELMLPL